MSYLCDFFAGAFICNCLPHLLSGLQGIPFPTPFGKPHGFGDSSPIVNVLWGSFNLMVGLLLLAWHPVVVGLPLAHAIPAVIERAAALADAFRGKRLPVVLVTVDGAAKGRAEQSRRGGDFPKDFSEVVPELKQQPTDHAVRKQTWGAFSNTSLAEHLRKLGVTQVVLAGVATSIGVESTARQAHELGFNVTLAVDAMTDMNPDAHANSITRIFPRLGETGTAKDIIDLLGKAAS